CLSSFSVIGKNWPSIILNKKPIDGIRPFSSSLNGSITFNNASYFLNLKNSSAAVNTIFYTYGNLNYEPNPLVEIDSYLPIPTSLSETFYLNGGEKYNETILDKLSFANIVETINTNNFTYTEVNSDSIFTDKNYKISFIEYDKITKFQIKQVTFDIDKPSEFFDKEKIGFELNSTNSSDIIYRHRGSYEPKT
ncbi:MAG: hypothetical protein P1P85_05875, partial [Patescibacteria group bacterium]|nr:hypothetical protein [Patescibacteria group bacterium]